MNENTDIIIKKFKESGMSQEEAFKFFDSLEPVACEFMKGNWKGSELRAGHMMEGMLTIAPWHGKTFNNPESVHPLIFEDRKGNKYSINPKKVFGLINSKTIMNFAFKFAGQVFRGEKTFDKHKLDKFFKLYKTELPYARLREINYRGKVSAAMVYDELAIIDIFRKLDENTVVGIMDIKGEMGKEGYFFMLEREEVK